MFLRRKKVTDLDFVYRLFKVSRLKLALRPKTTAVALLNGLSLAMHDFENYREDTVIALNIAEEVTKAAAEAEGLGELVGELYRDEATKVDYRAKHKQEVECKDCEARDLCWPDGLDNEKVN